MIAGIELRGASRLLSFLDRYWRENRETRVSHGKSRTPHHYYSFRLCQNLLYQKTRDKLQM